MNSEENNFETVVIEGQVWAVTPGNEDSELVNAAESAQETEAVADQQELDQPQESSTEALQDAAASPDAGDDVSSDTGDDQESSADSTEVDEAEFDPLRALTSLLLGGAIEGTTQLVSRLQEYEEELRRRAAEADPDDADASPTPEDELVRLRYAFVGLVLDAQATFWRNASLWARALDRSVRATDRVTEPVKNSYLFGPVQRRYERLVRRGEQSLARWVADGREAEPHSRELAKMTYNQIVDEFIHDLAENQELQELIAHQSIGLASEARDEVRERTVTADNLMEGIVRRILRRTPRTELSGPPPEVQRWGTLTLEEIKGESKPEDTES